ncbi:MAG: type II toxin-antitoxin system HicB family antitoxin [Leptolyngbya sp. BL-A-14]
MVNDDEADNLSKLAEEQHRSRIELAIVKKHFMDLTIELEQEEDGRWIAEILNLPGVLAYGDSQEDAVARVKALALRVLAEQIENGEESSKLEHVAFLAA